MIFKQIVKKETIKHNSVMFVCFANTLPNLTMFGIKMLAICYKTFAVKFHVKHSPNK